jgi:hypothetical protein
VLAHIHPLRRQFAGGLVPTSRIMESRFCARACPGTAKCPEPLCSVKALPSPRRCPAPSRRALPLLRRSYGLMRQTKSLSPPSACRPYGESLQVAASPCWEMALPDVISASLSLDAWTRTAVAREVHLAVTSLATSAFPTGLGGSADHNLPASSDFMRNPFRGRRHSLRSGLQVCLPPRSPPPLRRNSAGRPWRLHPSRAQFVTSLSIGYASRPNRPIDGAGTSTPPDSQPCRLLQPQRGSIPKPRVSEAPPWVDVTPTPQP